MFFKYYISEQIGRRSNVILFSNSRRGGRTGGRRRRAPESRCRHQPSRGDPTQGADLQRRAAEVGAEEAARARRLARRHAARHAARAPPGPPPRQLQVSYTTHHSTLIH